jgi:PilZ domain
MSIAGRLNQVTASAQLAIDRSYGIDLSARGYQVLFWSDEVNRCPGCGHSQWHVGRVTAECGICQTALPLAEAKSAGLDPVGRKAVALHVIAGKDVGLRRRFERRREKRVPADGRTVALHIDGSPHPFALQNISSGGVKGELLPGMAMAGSLVVELEDGTMLPAELRWCDDEFAGLAFITAKDS